MEIQTYLLVRKAFGEARKSLGKENKLSLEEFAILLYLMKFGKVTATTIADYQNITRPTMTHRGNHLSGMKVMSRETDEEDRRQVFCGLTEKGAEFIEECLVETSRCLDVLDPEMKAHDADMNLGETIIQMGSLAMPASSILLLAFMALKKDQITISQAVRTTGLLQPTASLSAGRLHDEGLLERTQVNEVSKRTAFITITRSGKKQARKLVKTINELAEEEQE